MSDFIYVLFKVGDQKSKCGVKDGMPVCYIDPDDSNYADWVPSRHTSIVYPVVRMRRDQLPDIRAALDPTHDLAGRKTIPKTYRARRGLITLSELEIFSGVANLESKLRGGDPVDIIDMTQTGLVIKSSAKLNPTVSDANAVSSGSYTVGSGGGDDYATLAAAFADVANLAGNLEFVVNSNITETAIALVTENKNGNNFTINSSSAHNGNPTQGWLITKNHTSTVVSYQMSGAGTFELCDLRFTTLSGGLAERFILVINATGTVNVHDLLLDANGQRMEGLYFDGDAVIINAYNCVIWNQTTSTTGRSIRCYGSWNASSKIENITIYSNAGGAAIDNGDLAITYKNIALFNNNSNFTNNANSISEYCATDKANVGAATDNNSQVDLDATNEFESIIDTNAMFLHLLKYPSYRRILGKLHTNGGPPAIAENLRGINHAYRPHRGGLYSIGAHEYLRKLGCYFTKPAQ